MDNSLTLQFIKYKGEIGKIILDSLPGGNYKNIVVKPNWVMHEENSNFSIEALVTSSDLIDKTLEACLEKYPEAETITVCDIPLQSCDWDLLIEQSGVNKLIEKYSSYIKPTIAFCDLRKERWKKRNGFLEYDNEWNSDPLGYAEVEINEKSFLDEISSNAKNFRVSDYDPGEILSVHNKGNHKYLISKTILNCDLFINLPKMKTHQKAGITGALKNLVGINGSKAYLVHHQKGIKGKGGDEFPENVSHLIFLQVRLRDLLQKRSRLLFKTARSFWNLIKKSARIETVGSKDNLKNENFYTGSGSWYGNDSIWRMVFDLNYIILFAGKNGKIIPGAKQREYLAILDGIISGEGNGPLQPLSVQSNLLLVSKNPFLIDISMAKLMAYDFNKIPVLRNYKSFQFSEWNSFEPFSFDVIVNGKYYNEGINSIPLLKKYIPPPGWRNHIEL